MTRDERGKMLFRFLQKWPPTKVNQHFMQEHVIDSVLDDLRHINDEVLEKALEFAVKELEWFSIAGVCSMIDKYNIEPIWDVADKESESWSQRTTREKNWDWFLQDARALGRSEEDMDAHLAEVAAEYDVTVEELLENREQILGY